MKIFYISIKLLITWVNTFCQKPSSEKFASINKKTQPITFCRCKFLCYSFLGLESMLGPRCPSHGHTLCSFQSTFLALTSNAPHRLLCKEPGLPVEEAIEPGPRGHTQNQMWYRTFSHHCPCLLQGQRVKEWAPRPWRYSSQGRLIICECWVKLNDLNKNLTSLRGCQ